MGILAELFASLFEVFTQLKALFTEGILRTRPKPAEASEPTIPEPGGRFAFTRAATIDAKELEVVGDVSVKRFDLELAPDTDELWVGDMLTFRVEFLDGRKPDRSWAWARAICPRADSVRVKLLRPPRCEHVHGLAANDVIEVPRAALGHVLRITASGAGA